MRREEAIRPGGWARAGHMGLQHGSQTACGCGLGRWRMVASPPPMSPPRGGLAAGTSSGSGAPDAVDLRGHLLTGRRRRRQRPVRTPPHPHAASQSRVLVLGWDWARWDPSQGPYPSSAYPDSWRLVPKGPKGLRRLHLAYASPDMTGRSPQKVGNPGGQRSWSLQPRATSRSLPSPQNCSLLVMILNAGPNLCFIPGT